MEADAFLDEFNRRCDLVIAPMERMADMQPQLLQSLARTGGKSDASQEPIAKFTRLTDEYHRLVADVESVRPVLEVREKIRAGRDCW